MSLDPFARPETGAPVPERLVIAGHPAEWRKVSIFGWTWLVMGSTWTSFGVWVVMRYFIPVEWSNLVQVFEDGLAMVVVSLCMLGLFVNGALGFAAGGLYFDDVRRLRRFRLLLDRRGIASADRPDAIIPWDRLRNVVVTSGNKGWRRLLVDDGAVPVWWWLKPKLFQPGRAHVRQLTSRHAFLVNILVDRLDVEAAEILRAIHHYSDGRFPNDPLPRWRRAGP